MTTKFLDLKNKNVIISGGSGFLGEQISQAFLKQGSNVFILDLNKPSLKHKMHYFKTDITKESHLKKILSFF